MNPITNNCNNKYEIGFMDPTALKGLVNDKTITEAEKIKVASTQFEAIFVKEFIKKGMQPLFGKNKNNQALISKGRTGYQETFLPEIISQRLAANNVFGLSQEFSKNIEQHP